MRAIDADELYEKLDKIRKEEVALYGVGNSRFCCTLSTALTEIDDAPTIEPQRKTGKWIDYSEDGYVECPFCHSATNCDDNIDELHFCFSCGTRLEVQDEAD